ncbi:DUF4010 domain-containing protein [Candidatus Peribacteria bacterium]|nr:DUF4010 domain-containing protein [Candidatus Peribacteria bacterium]
MLIKFFSTLALVYQDTFSNLMLQMTQSLPMLTSLLHHLPIYIVSVFSGLADVDAITQQMSELSSGTNSTTSLSTLVATTAIIIAVVTNTTVKIGLAKKF